VVLDHIKAENAYCKKEMKRLEPLQNELYKEMLSHLKETDEEVPFPYGDYLYFSKTIEGLSYRIHCRKPIGSEEEEVILDENKLAEGQEYLDVSSFESSPDHKLLAYAVDTDGSEIYDMSIKNLATGELLDDVLTETNGKG
jgi:oligopeptidase B